LYRHADVALTLLHRWAWTEILSHREKALLLALTTARRPAEELLDLSDDIALTRNKGIEGELDSDSEYEERAPSEACWEVPA